MSDEAVVGEQQQTSGDRVDEHFVLLSDRLRRDAVRYLIPRTGEWVDRERLADALSGRRTGRNRRSVDLQLHHVHLPRLEDGGVVDYDRDAGLVRYSGDERLERLLRCPDG